MKCYICENTELINILNKEPIELWSGASGDAKNTLKFKCELHQCPKCGHVQQNTTHELEDFLAKIYGSAGASVSTEMGEGNWGSRRAQQIIDEIDLKDHKSALELGSGNGYFLEYLKAKGFSDLAGIEPSLSGTYKNDNIQYYKEFARSTLNLNRKFDFIFAICVFEHIKGVNDVMRFVWNHLNEKGEFFFEVPNFHAEFKAGDPVVFMHEHIHYFTKSSLTVLLEQNGFSVLRIKEIRDSFFVWATKKKDFTVPEFEVCLYAGYEERLNSALGNLARIARDQGIAFHGVSNALNNILGWTGIGDNVGLFDNDETKVNKKHFGKMVRKPAEETINKYDHIVVVPVNYFNEIAKQYRELGFKGEIVGVTNNG
ncbi:MAG: class I SAM-dependent methyltransferase [Pseudomonadota bacterium]